jgi:hypothetical protein
MLTRGFEVDGTRVPLIGPQGIFKPAILPELPLSLTTVPVLEGRDRPYADELRPDGLLAVRVQTVAHHPHQLHTSNPLRLRDRGLWRAALERRVVRRASRLIGRTSSTLEV